MAGDDFVFVKLTEDGVAYANGGPISISNGRRAFMFVPDDSGPGYAPIRVERHYEWFGVLMHQHTPQGLPICELAPEPSSTVKETS